MGTYTLPGPNNTQRRTLPNGITVLVRENFASPAVVVSGYLLVGSEDEPSMKRGLAGFTADVLQRGTLQRPFAELYEQVESVGAGFGLASGTHIASFGAKGLAEHFTVLLDILSDVLMAPAFDPRQVERARTELLTDLQERAHDTRRCARLAFSELAYPETHPYHWSQLGYPESIEGITRDNLVDFYETFYSPERMVITAVGGIDAAEGLACIEQAFGNWQGSRPPRTGLPEVPRLVGAQERRVAVPDKSQSSLVLGWPGPERAHSDFIRCFVANTILGVFGMYGRLGKRVREQHGLAYYVLSSIDGGHGPGPWTLQAGLDPGNVQPAITLMLDELKRMQDTPVDVEELSDAVSYLTGSLPLALETNEGVARSLVNIERYALGLDYLQAYASLIGDVTVDQVQTVAQRWLDPENFALAVAGPGGGVA